MGINGSIIAKDLMVHYLWPVSRPVVCVLAFSVDVVLELTRNNSLKLPCGTGPIHISQTCHGADTC